MDYAALAKQFGGTTVTPANNAGSASVASKQPEVASNTPLVSPNAPSVAPKVDYSALASQFGGKTLAPTAPAEKPVGFVQGAIRAIASPFLRAGANLATLSDINNPAELKKDQSEGVSYGDYLGKYRPIGSELDAEGKPVSFGKRLVDTLGVGAEAAANFTGAGEAVDIAKAGLKGAIIPALIKGAKVGAATGALAGGGAEAQAPDATVGSIAGNAALGGAVGGVIGAPLEAAGPLIKAAKGSIDETIANRAAKAAGEVDRLAGAIAQGDAKDVGAVKNTLQQVDLSGAKTYADAAKAVDSHIASVAENTDRVLETDPTKKTLSDLSFNAKIGGETIEHNYVDDALKQLDEFYTKTNDLPGKAQIAQIRQKALTEGLTVKEINDIARVHGKDLSGFNASGELASGLSKQAAENTRKGLKATARGIFGDKIFKEADSAMADFIKTKGLFQDMADKVQTAQQKIRQMSLPQKIGDLFEKAVNVGTLGTSRGALRAAGNAMGVRTSETMSALELQKVLQKNITKINDIFEKGSAPETIIKKLQDFIDQSKNRLALPEPKSVPSGDTIYVTPKGKATPVAQEAGDVAAVEQGKAKTSPGKTPKRADTSGFYGDPVKEIQVGKPGKSAKSDLPVIDAGRVKPPVKPGDIQLNKANAPKVFSPKKQGGYISLGKLAAGAGIGAAGVAAAVPSKFSVTNPEQKTEVQSAQGLDPQDKNLIAATVFGELSNKGNTAEEARKIINTVVNRMKETGKSARDIITAPNQYQAYGKDQFMNAIQGKLDPLSQKKMAVVNAAIEDLYSGKLKDNTNGSVFYQHDKDGNLSLKPGKLKK